MDTIHPFEKAGLGKAPFRYVGIEAQEISHGRRVLGSVGGCEMTTKPGGSCAFCAHYILDMFVVESADGQRFHVGCDCIRKVDAKLTRSIEADAKKAKKDREAARIKAAREMVWSQQAYSLRCQPHPSPYHAGEGKNLAHYVEWLFQNGGTSGQLRAARLVEKAISCVVSE